MGRFRTSEKGQALLLTGSKVLQFQLIALVNWAYRLPETTVLTARILQNTAGAVFLLMALGLMKLSGKPFAAFGLSLRQLPKQLLSGVVLWCTFALVYTLLQEPPAIPEALLYTLLSQLLVGAWEESFWRGYVLHTLHDLTGSVLWAIGLSSLIFALIHMPNYGFHTTTPLIIGAVFAVLHLKHPHLFTIPALSLTHALLNAFIMQ